jgi:hypothetical protein
MMGVGFFPAHLTRLFYQSAVTDRIADGVPRCYPFRIPIPDFLHQLSTGRIVIVTGLVVLVISILILASVLNSCPATAFFAFALMATCHRRVPVKFGEGLFDPTPNACFVMR